MRAVVLEDAGKMSLWDVPEPEPADDEVKIKIVCCGVCGSDIHSYDGSLPMQRKPLIQGHEFSGVVHSVGKDVTRFKPGQRVTAQNYRFTDHLILVGVQEDGAMTEYICMQEQYVFLLPDNISFEEGSLIEPACVSGHAVLDYADLRPADHVAVMGAGTIGLMAALVAKACGANVTLIGRSTSADRLAIGKKLGIDLTLMSDRDDVRGILMERTAGRGVDVAIEAAGSDASIVQALSLVRMNGKYIELALTAHTGSTISNFSDVVQREITIYGSNCHRTENWPRIIEMVSSGLLCFDGIISKSYPLEAYEEAFHTKAMKNLLCP